MSILKKTVYQGKQLAGKYTNRKILNYKRTNLAYKVIEKREKKLYLSKVVMYIIIVMT